MKGNFGSARLHRGAVLEKQQRGDRSKRAKAQQATDQAKDVSESEA